MFDLCFTPEIVPDVDTASVTLPATSAAPGTVCSSIHPSLSITNLL